MAECPKLYDIETVSEYSKTQSFSAYKPIKIGNYSISEEGDFADCNKANIPTLKSFQLPLDLNEGYKPGDTDQYVSKWEELLKWIQNSPTGYQYLAGVDVVAKRGVLKDIGITNHNFYRNPWKFEVCKYAGKLYIKEVDEPQNLDAWGHQNTYWGIKFEDYVIEREPNINATYQVLTGKIGGRKVLLSAEVDAINDKGEVIEIKTCFQHKLASKIPQAWLQSFLGRVDLLMYGWKERNGMVYSNPVAFPMENIAGSQVLAKSDADAMFGILGDVIDWACTSVPETKSTWLLEYSGGTNIRLSQRSDQMFLPRWYTEFIDRRRNCASPENLVDHVEHIFI